MGQLAVIIKISNASQADLSTLRQQFQTFIKTTLPQAVQAANPTTQMVVSLDANSTYAENF
jgi:hypothetical protein